MEITEGLYVEVYRNLHKKCWSVRYKGKVIWHTSKITLKNAKLVVQPAGNAKVRREGQKNVHALVRGYITWDLFPAELTPESRITYNPYDHTTFVGWKDYKKVTEASMIYMHIELGAYAIPQNAKSQALSLVSLFLPDILGIAGNSFSLYTSIFYINYMPFGEIAIINRVPLPPVSGDR